MDYFDVCSACNQIKNVNTQSSANIINQLFFVCIFTFLQPDMLYEINRIFLKYTFTFMIIIIPVGRHYNMTSMQLSVTRVRRN